MYIRGLKIGQVAQLYGVHENTLRNYDKQGLLTPPRTWANYRIYTPKILKKLEGILAGGKSQT